MILSKPILGTNIVKSSMLTLLSSLIISPLALSDSISIYDQDLPFYQQGYALKSQEIGTAFIIKSDINDDQQLIAGYAGTYQNSHVFFHIDDYAIQEQGLTYEESLQRCQSLGSGWTIPTRFQIPLTYYILDLPDSAFLPAPYWTRTFAPCIDCLFEDNYLLTYDIVSQNFNTNYIHPDATSLSVCMKLFD